MKKIKIFYILSTALFVAVETLLGILLQIGSGRAVAIHSFVAIVLACLFCFIFARPTKEYLLTQTALICTVIADYFLVLCDPRIKLPAMIFFLVTQICYMIRIGLADESGKRRNAETIVRMVASLGIVTATVAVLGKRCDLLAIVSMLYYVHLFLNIVFAFIRIKRNLLVAIGLLLFILCDTLVGLAMLDEYLPVDARLISRIVTPGFDLAWAFYLPSQMILALSLFPRRFKRWKKIPKSERL